MLRINISGLMFICNWQHYLLGFVLLLIDWFSFLAWLLASRATKYFGILDKSNLVVLR